MAQQFVNIPVPAANGAGAAVDVSTMGKTKTLVCGGTFDATVNIEYSTDPMGGFWAPLATFQKPGHLTTDIAANFLRAVTSKYQTGTANVDCGGDDSGSVFAQIPNPPSQGVGAQVDISALPLYKTVVLGTFNAAGAINIEVSEDGVSWAQVMTFHNAGGKSLPFFAQYARARSDAPIPLSIWIGGANDSGGGGAEASALLSIYGDGSFGDYQTNGDETWSSTSGAPGAPTVPSGSSFPFAFFNNLTISPGDSVAVGELDEDENAGQAIVIFVKDTLTIGEGGRIHANGEAGGSGQNINGNPGGSGRLALPGSSAGSAGGRGGYQGAPLGDPNGAPGLGGSDRAAFASGNGGAGGNSGPFQIEPEFTGGAGGESTAPVSWPYSLALVFSVASLLTKIGGGNGGGGGAGSGLSGFGGGGGGGAGTLVIFAKNIVAPEGSIQCKGGDGGDGYTPENVPAGGGGGGMGGTLLIVTENETLLGICDVSGGAGGDPAGNPADPGEDGADGDAVAFNPMLAAQIPT